MGLASAAFVGTAKVRPLAIYDPREKKSVEFGDRALWAYVWIPRTGAVSRAVIRIVESLLSERVQVRLAGLHFKSVAPELRAEQLRTLRALSAGECGAGRARNGLTIVEPPDRLMKR
jgi:hypothetical protein